MNVRKVMGMVNISNTGKKKRRERILKKKKC